MGGLSREVAIKLNLEDEEIPAFQRRDTRCSEQHRQNSQEGQSLWEARESLRAGSQQDRGMRQGGP